MVAARTPNIVAAAASGCRKSSVVAREPRRRKRLSWEDKLRPGLQPSVVADKRSGQPLLLPTPLLIAETIATVPRGQVITLSCLREQLARRFNTQSTCPLMTGIFAGILAGAVADDLAAHRKPRWPIWRLVRDDGTLNPKWPLDVLYRASLLRAEGVRLTRRRGTWAVLGSLSRTP
jgi:alkylated DNA nucleotide flippase Atl1